MRQNAEMNHPQSSDSQELANIHIRFDFPNDLSAPKVSAYLV